MGEGEEVRRFPVIFLLPWGEGVRGTDEGFHNY